MDLIDQAELTIELHHRAAIAGSKREEITLPATGYCHYCGRPVCGLLRRWCNAECRDEWEKHDKHERARGGK